jgi:hypothetical protein
VEGRVSMLTVHDYRLDNHHDWHLDLNNVDDYHE